MAQWAATQPARMKDIYFCRRCRPRRCRQRKPGGNERAARHADDALALKAIWIDIDVKPDKPEKAYVSKSEAVSALHQFIADACIPPPTAVVFSGGGVHAYWISDRPLTVAEWQPYAEGLKALAQQHGLKCDYGLTTDARASSACRAHSTTRPTRRGQSSWRGLLPADYDFASCLGAHQRGGRAEGCHRRGKCRARLGSRRSRPRPRRLPDRLTDGMQVHEDISRARQVYSRGARTTSMPPRPTARITTSRCGT